MQSVYFRCMRSLTATAPAAEILCQGTSVNHIPFHPLPVLLHSDHYALAGLPAQSALKAVMTGVELLLARAQLWQTTAAQRVSLQEQLQPLGSLAARWRRLELQAWHNLLDDARARHAAGTPSSACLSLLCLSERGSRALVLVCCSAAAAACVGVEGA